MTTGDGCDGRSVAFGSKNMTLSKQMPGHGPGLTPGGGHP